MSFEILTLFCCKLQKTYHRFSTAIKMNALIRAMNTVDHDTVKYNDKI